MSNKALLIGVGLFVTIVITSGVIFTVNKARNVYKRVYETNTQIEANFDEYDAYENSEKTSLDMLNTAKKYRDSDTVFVVETKGNLENYIGNRLSDYEKLLNASVNKINGSTQIEFLTNRLEENGGANGFNYATSYKTYVNRLNNDKVIIVFDLE